MATISQDKTNDIIKEVYGYIHYNDIDFRKQVLSSDEVYISLNDLLMYSIELYELTISHPLDILNLFKESLNNHYDVNIELRFYDCPISENINLNEIKMEHINRLICVRSMIKRKSGRLIKDIKHYYLCSNPSCNHSQDYIQVPQTENKVRRLKCCPRCKSAVEYHEKLSTNYQNYIIEEIMDEIGYNNEPTKMPIELSGGLTNDDYNNNLIVGSKAEVICVVREKNKSDTKEKSVYNEFYLEAIGIEKLEYDLNSLEIEDNTKHRIKEQSENSEDIGKDIIDSFAPNIYGLEKEKLGLILGLLGGSSRDKKRNRSHILFVGDPGLGKSELLDFGINLMPKSKKVSGEGSSGVGLTATVVRDEFTGQWMPEAGAMVKSNGGYLMIDELDKIVSSDVTKLNTGMEEGKIYIDKAGVSAEMNARATIIASANPKNGKFKKVHWNNSDSYSDQIQIDSTLLSRFDLIFILIDENTEEDDENIANFIFEEETDPPYDIEELRNHIVYRHGLNPRHTEESKNFIVAYYKDLRKKSNEDDILITNRQVIGLKRLSEAYAKLYLRDYVTEEDCKAVIDLMEYSQKRMGVSELMTNVSNTKRGKNRVISEIIENVCKSSGYFTMDGIMPYFNEEINEKDIKDVIEKMLREGELFEPRRGHFKLVI